MKKRIFRIISVTVLLMCLVLMLTGCESDIQENEVANEISEEYNQDDEKTYVEITILAGYVGGTTQEELNREAEEKGYKEIRLHEDGSATYVMTKQQQQELLSGIAEQVDELTKNILEQYKNVSAVEPNGDFTHFIVKVSDETADEEFYHRLGMGYTVIAAIYAMYDGRDMKSEDIRLIFKNQETDQQLYEFVAQENITW